MRLLHLALFAATVATALSPALDRLADVSFAWHMVQHLLLLLPAPLFLLLAQPLHGFAYVAGKGATAKLVRATRRFHVLAHPALTLFAFVATLWVTHFSGWYGYALTHPWAHAAEHAAYLVAGTFFWLPVIAPPPLRPPAFPARLLYLLVALPQGALLAFALGSAQRPLYAYYAMVEHAHALADQRNAAALMWIAMGLMLFGAFLVTLGVWAARESRAPAALALRAR